MLKWVAYLNIEIVYVCILEQHLHLSLSVLQIYTFHWPFLGGSCHFYVISVLQAYISYKVLYEIKKCMFLRCNSCFSFQNDYNWTCIRWKGQPLMCHMVYNRAVSSKWLEFYDYYIFCTYNSILAMGPSQSINIKVHLNRTRRKKNTIYSKHNIKIGLNSIFQNDSTGQHVCDTLDRMNTV